MIDNKCRDGIHYFSSEAWDSRCECLVWSRREHRNRQGQGIASGAKHLWKQAKKEWALNKIALPVIQYDPEGSVVAIYRSMKDAGIALGINYSNIALATKGKRKTAGGCKWELA